MEGVCVGELDLLTIYTQFGSTRNYIVIDNLHALQITIR
jgi:hypothetical protein